MGIRLNRYARGPLGIFRQACDLKTLVTGDGVTPNPLNKRAIEGYSHLDGGIRRLAEIAYDCSMRAYVISNTAGALGIATIIPGVSIVDSTRRQISDLHDLDYWLVDDAPLATHLEVAEGLVEKSHRLVGRDERFSGIVTSVHNGKFSEVNRGLPMYLHADPVPLGRFTGLGEDVHGVDRGPDFAIHLSEHTVLDG